MSVTIYHNPKCGTSRKTLALILQAGVDPVVIEYLQHPPTRERLLELIAQMQISPRELLRERGTPYDDLGLDDTTLSDDDLVEAMVDTPILINRPIVETPVGTRLCRPSELVLPLLQT